MAWLPMVTNGTIGALLANARRTKPRERHVAGQVDVALRDRVDETLAGQARRQILLLRLTAHGDEERPCSDLRDVHERRVPRATDDYPRRAEEAVAVA